MTFPASTNRLQLFIKVFFFGVLAVLIIGKHLFLLYLDKIKENQKDTFNFRLKIID